MVYEELMEIDVNGTPEQHRLRFTFDCEYMTGHYVPIIRRTEKIWQSGRVTEAGDFWDWCPLPESVRIEEACVKAYLVERGMTLARASHG